MGLVDDLIAEQDRRRQELNIALDIAKQRREGPGVFGTIAQRGKTGTVRYLGHKGRGLEATAKRVSTPMTELTPNEYEIQRDKDLSQQYSDAVKQGVARQVSDIEKPLLDEAFKTDYVPTKEDLNRVGIETPEQNPLTRSTMLHVYRPVDPTTGEFVERRVREVSEEEMTPIEKNSLIARRFVAKPFEVAGKFYGDVADKVIEDNPQWQPPDYLKGRGAWESIWADDLTAGDKFKVVLGSFVENTPQLVESLGLTVAGFFTAGPPGAIAGRTMGMGGNYLAETGAVYDEIKKAHPDVQDGDAAATAVMHGLTSTALELAPAGALLNKIPGIKDAIKKQTLRELLRKPKLVERVVKGAFHQSLVEAATEGMQEISANVAKGVYEQNPQYFKDVDESMFMGWLVGLVTGGLVNLTTHRSAVKQFNDERLQKLNSEQLFQLASNPELLEQEKISRDEVIEVAEQVRIVEGLENIQERMSKEGVTLEDVAESESEQAARYLTRVRNAERSLHVADVRHKIREENFSDKDLNLLVKKPEALKRYGLTAEDVQSLIDERTEEKLYVKQFEEILAAAPSDSVRQGIMDSLQGAYYQGITRVLEAQGKPALRTDLMKGPVEIPEPPPKKKAKPKKKAAKKETVDEAAEQILVTKKVHKTKDAAIGAYHKLKNKESFYILKDKEGFKLKYKKVQEDGSLKAPKNAIIPEAEFIPGEDVPLASKVSETSEIADTDIQAIAKEKGIIFNGIQEMPEIMRQKGFTDQLFFTDPKTKGTFVVTKLEEVSAKLTEMREKFAEADKQLRRDPKFARWFKYSKVTDEKGKPRVVYHGSAAAFDAFDPELLGTSTRAESAKQAFFFTSDADQAEQFAYLSRRRGSPGEGGNIALYPVYLSLQNPYEMTYGDMGISDAIKIAKEKGHDGLIIHKSLDAPNQGHVEIRGEIFDFDFRGSDFDTDLRNYWRNPTEEGYQDILEQLETTVEFYKEEGTDYYEDDQEGLDYYKYEMGLWEDALETWKTKHEEFRYVEPPTATTYAVFKNTQAKSIFNLGEYDPANPDLLASQQEGAIEKPLTTEEVYTRLEQLIGKVPDFIEVVEELDPKVRDLIANTDSDILLSQDFTAPHWTSRVEQAFEQTNADFKTADEWIRVIKEWSKDKVKRGKVKPGSAKFPIQVQDEIIFSGLPEWLADAAEYGETVTRQDIVDFLKKFNRYKLDEQTWGYNHNYHKLMQEAEALQKPLMDERGKIQDDLRNRLEQYLRNKFPNMLVTFGELREAVKTLGTLYDQTLRSLQEAITETSLYFTASKELEAQGVPDGRQFTETSKAFEPILQELEPHVKKIKKLSKDISDIEADIWKDLDQKTDPHEGTFVLRDGTIRRNERVHLFNFPAGRYIGYDITRAHDEEPIGKDFRTYKEAEDFIKEQENPENFKVTPFWGMEHHDENFQIHYSGIHNFIHMHADERISEKDKLKVFMINEIQSDWFQQARQYGFEDTYVKNALLGRAHTFETLLRMDITKDLNDVNTARITADPTSRQGFKILGDFTSEYGIFAPDEWVASYLQDLVDAHDKMEPLGEKDFIDNAIQLLKNTTLGFGFENTFEADITDNLDPDTLLDNTDLEDAIENGWGEFTEHLRKTRFFKVIGDIKNQKRSLKAYIEGEADHGYPGLTDDFIQHLKNYITRKGSATAITGQDIRNLTPAEFRKQFKKLSNTNEVYTAKLVRKLLSREQMLKIQEFMALHLDIAKRSGEIQKPPMRTTWEAWTMKRATQQAVMEGQNYVAWPSTAEQVAAIEGWTDIVETPKGRYFAFVGVGGQERLKKDYNTKTAGEALDIMHDVMTKEVKKNALFLHESNMPYRNFTAIMNRYLKTLPKVAKSSLKKYGVMIEEFNLERDPNQSSYRDPQPVKGFKINKAIRRAVINGLPVASQRNKVQGVYYNGKIQFVANAIESAEQVKGLLVHEGGHYLRRNDEQYQTKYQELVDQFTNLAMNPTSARESIAISQAWKQALRDKRNLSEDLVREEALMYFLQEEANQKLSLWQKFKNLIKQWLHRTLGLTPKQLKMTGRQMVDVVMYDLKQEIARKNKETVKTDVEVKQALTEAFVAASKRKDIKPYKRSKADNILDDLFEIPRDVRQTESFHEADSALMYLDMAKRLKDKEGRTLSKLTARILGNDIKNVKAFKRRKHEQTASWLNRILSSPEYYFMKDSTAKRILDIAKRKNDIKHEWKNTVEGDFVKIVKQIKKRNIKAYIKANAYLLEADKTGKGFRIVQADDGKWIVHNRNNKATDRFKKEEDAVNAMILAEQEWLKHRGYSPDTLKVIKEARELTNRGFDLSVADMRRQIKTNKEQGIEEPKIVYEDDNGVRNDISLSEAIAMMGDLRGTYFPRERQAKGYSLQAKGEGLPNRLFTYDAYIPLNVKDFSSKAALKKAFNTNMPVGRKIRELEKQGYTDMVLSPVRNPSGMLFDVPGLLMSMDRLLSESDERLSTKVLEEADKEALRAASEALTLRIADIYKAKGQLSSRMRRSEVLWEGYEEDALKALASYAQRVSTGAAMRQTAREMLLTFTGRDVSWSQYAEENPDASYRSYRIWVKQKAINATTQKQLYEDVRTYITYMLKPDARLDRIIGYMKAGATLKFLGLRLSSAAINLTNMGMAVPATLSAHTGLSLTRSWGFIGEAASKYALYRLGRLKKTNDVSPTLERKIRRQNKGVILTQKDIEIFDEISRRGWDEAQFNHESARVLQDSPNKVFDMTLKGMMYFFGATEKINRATTIFAAYKAHEAAQKKKGTKRSKEFFYKMAQHVSDRAHGTYGKAAKPWWVQKARPLDLLYTFQKFQHNYMLNMTEIGIKGLQNRNKLAAMKNVTYMLLAPAIVAGTGASLLAKFAFNLIKLLFDEDDPEEDFYNWFDEKFGEDTTMSRLARHGVTGALFHINLRGSIQMNNPIPTDMKELGGAPGSIAIDFWDSVVHFNKSEWKKGAEKLGPTFLGSALKAIRESTEGVTTKTYTPVYYGTEPLKADTVDAVLRFGSFNPSRLSAIREKQWRELKVNEAYTKRRSEIKQQINKMLVQGTANEEKWGDIFNQIGEYNERMYATSDRVNKVYIDDQWLMNTIRDIYTPKKAEKMRTIHRGE